MAEMNALEPAPFKLKWVRQGKVAWRRDHYDKYGPTRTHIPGLDEHIGYANFDLQRNNLPTIARDSADVLYVMAIRPLTEAEMAQIHTNMLGYFGHPQRARECFASRVLRPLDELAAVLNFAAYHGFMPAEDSPGLRYLRTLFPPTQYEVEFPDGPQAGL
jgi:hypothetical protein